MSDLDSASVPRIGTVTGSVREALTSATDALRAAGVDSPRLDAELLLTAATGRDRAALAASPEAGVDARAAREFGAMVRRRVQREPVAYILGSRGFRRIELRCDPRALIPRPETELLVEVALELGPRSVLDVGTGTGAIALAVADELRGPVAPARPAFRDESRRETPAHAGREVFAVDTSAGALALARENAAALGLEGRVTFELGSLPSRRDFDLVLANLPYVRDDEWPTLAPEITRYEPREALTSGPDGLDAIRALLADLAPAGRVRADAVALEIGAEQGAAVSDLVRTAGFAETEVRRDLAGLDRVVIGHRVVPNGPMGTDSDHSAVSGAAEGSRGAAT